MSEPARSHVLLSVRPRFADLIMAGTKTVEIRRGPSRVAPGTTALVYSSSPTRALVGAVVIDGVNVRAASTVWRNWGTATGLGKREFDAYVSGCGRVTALLLGARVAFPQPIDLAELRSRTSRFVAPQSYRFVAEAELGAVLNGERALVDSLLDE